MKNYLVRYSKGQLKIQEMSFVLIAILLFLVMAGLFYISLRFTGIKEDVSSQRSEEASELVRRLSDSPELRWSSEHQQCKGCIDFDKIILLKEKSQIYKELWNMAHLSIEIIYPEKEGECTKANYPDCKTITIINSSQKYQLQGAFVSICRQEFNNGRRVVCELGKIYASAKEIPK